MPTLSYAHPCFLFHGLAVVLVAIVLAIALVVYHVSSQHIVEMAFGYFWAAEIVSGQSIGILELCQTGIKNVAV